MFVKTCDVKYDYIQRIKKLGSFSYITSYMYPNSSKIILIFYFSIVVY